jgi:hypothetical protein
VRDHEQEVGEAEDQPSMRTIAKKDPAIELLDEAMVEVLRRKTPAERVAMILAANRTMRLRLEGHLRSRHPDWDDRTVIEEIARRMSRGAG